MPNPNRSSNRIVPASTCDCRRTSTVIGVSLPRERNRVRTETAAGTIRNIGLTREPRHQHRAGYDPEHPHRRHGDVKGRLEPVPTQTLEDVMAECPVRDDVAADRVAVILGLGQEAILTILPRLDTLERRSVEPQ